MTPNKPATDASWIVIVAGGSGARMGSELPKQFMALSGKPVLLHALERMQAAIPHANVLAVLPEAHHATWEKLAGTYPGLAGIQLCAGGETRFHSVKNALNAIPDEDGFVAIHDAVRPLVPEQLVRDAWHAAQVHWAAIPVVALRDSVRRVYDNGRSEPVDRSPLRLVQTPQCFRLGALKKAFNRPYEERFTDDAVVWEAAGGQVHLVVGAVSNIKITTSEDMYVAEALLAAGY